MIFIFWNKLLKIRKIILPIINFIAATNLATMLKAKIYYADVNPDTGQMTPETLEKCIKINKNTAKTHINQYKTHENAYKLL